MHHPQHLWTRSALGAIALALAPAAALTAQLDYRNLDAHRPARVEDAYVIERGAMEWIAGSDVAFVAGAVPYAHTLEITLGVLPDAHLGLAAPIAARDIGNKDGLAGLALFALYSFNTESLGVPALSLRGDWRFPVGGFGGRAARGALTAVATRSFGLTRVHANASAGLGPSDAGGLEGIPRWWAGVALDRTLFRRSLLLIGEATTEEAAAGGAARFVAGMGLRWQLTPLLVLDVGAERRLSAEGPDLGLTLGLTLVQGAPWHGR